MTKTEQALKLIDEGMTVRQAARQVDMSESALHSAVKRRRDDHLRTQGICPCCGQAVRAEASLK